MTKNPPKSLEDWCAEAHNIAKSSGFWDGEREFGTMIALLHSELSELLEVLRKNPEARSSKLDLQFSAAEEEAADVFIRLADMCGGLGFDLEGAVFAKMSYNKTRERLHGKLF